MKKLIKVIGIGISLLLLSIIGLYMFQEKLIFRSEKLPQDYTFNFDFPFEEITLQNADGKALNALLFKAERPKGLVIYFHGNKGNLSDWGALAPQFTSQHYDVLMMDYRGYGKSRGKRSEKVLYQDANLLFKEAKKQYDEAKIVVYGRSLGTTFATYVAAKNRPKKLILESPFYSMIDLVSNKYPILPVEKLLKYSFETGVYMQDVMCPVTIIHGTDDGVVPFSSGQKLFWTIAEEKRKFIVIKNGKHNNLNTFQEHALAIRNELIF